MCGVLPSPALVVELTAADRTIARAAAFFAGRRVRLRPHFKAHKCTRLLRRQLEAGSCSGATCATAHEARVLAEAGFEDVLVANEVAELAGGDESPLDEIQAGSYGLMDATYARLGLPFEPALRCRTTVLSPHGERVVLDAGLKALSAEYGLPAATEPGMEILSLADEHATARVPAGSALRVGDVTHLVPAHVDPTVNLHPSLMVDLGDGRIEAWPVDGRVRSEP